MSLSLVSRRLALALVLVLAGLLGSLAIHAAAPPARAEQDEATPSSSTSTSTSASTDTTKGDSTESFLSLMWRRAGAIEVVIGGMSFYLIAVVVWMGFQYRRPVAVPDSLVRELGELLGQKRFSEAYQRLAADRSFLARVLGAGVRKLPAGQGHALRAMEMANDDATMEMEHRTTYLATVGTLGPMIGLVGTVYGMILSFRVIATAGSSPQASQLATGISTALFATLEGIALSIPAIYFYALFRNRIARLSLEVAIMAESLLDQFSSGVRTPHPLAAAAVSQANPVAPRSALPPTDRPIP